MIGDHSAEIAFEYLKRHRAGFYDMVDNIPFLPEEHMNRNGSQINDLRGLHPMSRLVRIARSGSLRDELRTILGIEAQGATTWIHASRPASAQLRMTR